MIAPELSALLSIRYTLLTLAAPFQRPVLSVLFATPLHRVAARKTR